MRMPSKFPRLVDGDTAAATREPLTPPEGHVHIGVDWAGRDLRGHDLSGFDLNGACLDNTDLRGVRFVGASLRGASLFGADLRGAELMQADLQGARMDECLAAEAGFAHANMTGASLFQAELTHATLMHANLEGADLRAAKLDEARLCEARLYHTDLSRAHLRHADLENCDVHKAVFTEADLRGARLRGLRGFNKACFLRADIREVDFSGAYLLRRAIMDTNYLHEFRTRDRFHGALYWLWWATSDCGRSLSRWSLLTAVLTVAFGLGYSFVSLDYGLHETSLSPFYFSLVTLTTLGYGDVVPASTAGQALAMCEVVVGYLMLGGVISIFANKMARRAD